MDTAKKNNSTDLCDNEKRRTPSPEPFKEPDGMVTIELDRNSPSPQPLSSPEPLKKVETCSIKYLSYLSLITLLCLISFAATVLIHREDIGWLSKKLTTSERNETFYSVPTASPFQVTQNTVPIEMETCPADPQEEYKIHLVMCERTKTFDDCCHMHIRSRLPQINDVCSILEMLDLLVEYKTIYLMRTERDVDVEYNEEDYKKEKEKKKQEKIRTKEKIMSYIRHLNKPLQREIPALFDWLGDLFLEYQEEFEGDEIKNGAESKHLPSLTHYPIHENPSEQSNDFEQPESYLEARKIENNTKNGTLKLGEHGESEQKIANEVVSEESSMNQTNNENIHSRLEEISVTESENQSNGTTENIVPTAISSKEELVPIEDAKEQKRKKRDESDESYLPQNNGYPPFENFGDDDFEFAPPYDQNANMESNQNIMESYDFNPENYVNQADKNFEEGYPVVGLSPERTSDDTPRNVGYHSLINDGRRDEELRLPIHTEERDFARQTWKDLNIYGFTQSFTFPQETTTRSSPEYTVRNDQVTYSYLDPMPAIPKVTNDALNEVETDKIIESELPRKRNRINDKEMKLPTDSSYTIGYTSTPKATARLYVDATDSIESIENIRANNESVVLEIGKTKILVSKSNNELDDDMKKQESNERQSTTDKNSKQMEENNEIQQGDVMSSFESTNSGSVENSRSAAQATKGNTFQLVNEDTQSGQNLFVNPNVCQYPQPLGSPNRFVMGADNHPQIISMVPPANIPKQPVYVINPSVFSYLPPSPVIPHYGPVSQQYNPYAFINPLSTAPISNMASGPVQMANSNGQVYLCNPALQTANVPTSNTQAVEIRSSNNLQESFDRVPMEIRTSNKTRTSLTCPINEQSCLDGSKCISVRHVCDNEVHCEDGSDETFCSCRERIAEIRLCDGYFDCPDGEDERGCFGCSEDEINCDDWSRFRKGTCVPMSQRCDGIRQCEITGRDEDDCSILTDHIGESNPMKISNAAGFLHRNYKGKWFPTCFGSEVWALEVCKVEAGPSTIAPMSHLVPTTEKYEGEYINLLPNQEVSFAGTCVQDRASFVECPPLFCGLRMTIKNPYRPQELDTSIEDMMNHLNRQDYTFGEDFDLSRRANRSTNRNKRSDDFILGGERVVGGKASQPAAWPWVVSIYKNGIFHCGGVIINEWWILTAAHCVDKYWLFYYEIQAGILRRFSYSPMEQVRWVVAAIAHEEYDKSNLKNDIALMRLSSAVRYNRYVRPICLPSETTAGTDFRRGPSPGTICTTVGWGATVEHGTDPDHMREVEVPVLKSCKHPEDIEGKEICAGLFEGGKDACQGDSGGPFMCQNPNNPSQWYLAGIVSHGEGCARPDEPGVYTRVSQYMDWIADNMRERNFFSRQPLQKCPGYICKGTNKCIPKKRHCDKVVDCLMGDDELNCENRFHNIFKFSGDSFMPFFRSMNTLKTEAPDNNEDDGNILGAVIINSDFENSTETPKPKDIQVEKMENISRVIYHYEKIPYFNNNTKNPDYFRCDQLLQMIPIGKRCDKTVDCEDGTDEQGCRCVDYIKLNHENAICDGVIDCKDKTDESLCFACREGEFNCMKSRMCISRNLVCDGKHDCSKGEDESDCVALTDGKTLLLDDTNRPNMSLYGVVSVNRFGIWRPYCNTSHSKADATIASNICNYLGFGEYTRFEKVQVVDNSLLVKNIDSTSLDPQENSFTNDSMTCDGLYVWCSYVNSDSTIEHAQKESKINDTYEATWNAAIFSDGLYKCMGVILNEKWVLTSVNCFDGILHYNIRYLAVVVGKGARYFDVPGPNDQICNVAESYQVVETDIAVLRLEKSIQFNRYVQPTYLNMRIDNNRKERCVAVGLKNGRSSLLFLQTKSNCSRENTCFHAASTENCLDGPWSGVITCYAGNGWYPASVFSSMGKFCPFKDDANFTSVRYWAKDIHKYAGNLKSVTQKSFCDGFRCDLGNCIDVDQICDGIPQCLGGEDETPLFCQKKRNACPILKNCACPVDHLTCLNGKCVHKSKFCDRVNDCGDYSDEPPRCTCRSFMKLTHPEKVCDGHINCFDGTDENPKMCQCKSGDFICGKSRLCVANEMVCNGFRDCPDGEDEKECYALALNISSDANSGEVLTRTAGQLFDSCFLESPPEHELNNICRQLGFVSSNSSRMEPYPDEKQTALVPVIDTFSVVWIRREGRVPLLFRMRTGNDAYLTFRTQSNCHRLHIECI
ncbi:uncharacterized protein LOC123315190 [Coccinella septempunctata]|uniref:uncharacterized protein LOC123315190 n=1 Tax=Coccinella septempunctata TaxID=41139 RepID=UPI001D08084B|nr:uncharacterized protein LOC123315190 [Coccinella septempunctata]